jgi:hypothetical protein
MTVTLAQAVDRLASGPYRDVTFTREQLRELRYAGLLHDFGKVGVREQVLVKEKKLYPHDLDLIRHRFAFLVQRAELEYERARAELLIAGGRPAYETGLVRLECERRTRREELARFLDTIIQANEPTVLAEGSFDALEAHDPARRATTPDVRFVEYGVQLQRAAAPALGTSASGGGS